MHPGNKTKSDADLGGPMLRQTDGTANLGILSNASAPFLRHMQSKWRQVGWHLPVFLQPTTYYVLLHAFPAAHMLRCTKRRRRSQDGRELVPKARGPAQQLRDFAAASTATTASGTLHRAGRRSARRLSEPPRSITRRRRSVRSPT